MRKTTFKCCCLIVLLLVDIQVGLAQSGHRKSTNSKQLQTTGNTFNGVLQGKMSVNPSGVATYSISLELPPGNQGAEPSLQLSYSSQSGNGLLGMGWSMSGFSAVTRAGATVPQDGFRGGVNYNADDRFSLDGIRLMNNAAQSSAYFRPGSSYYTELQTWKKVTANGTAGQGPASFTVQLKNGAVATYGSGNGSQVLAQGPSFNSAALQGSVSKWLIQNYTSSSGNQVTFSYTKTPSNVQGQPMTGCAADGYSYPDVITYGITGTNAANRFVKFYYEPRPDTLLRFSGGANSSVSVRLKAIRTYLATGNDTLAVKTYRITYDSSSPAPISRIAAVTELGSYGAASAPVSLQWTNGPNGFVKKTVAYGGPLTNTGYEGDFNGDGKTDLLPVSSSNSVEAIYYANGNGFTTQKLGAPINITDQTYVADYNGDGFPDLLVLNAGQANIYFCDPQTYVLNTKPVIVRGMQFNSNCVTCVFSADINGDAMADLCSVSGTSANVYLSDGNGFKPLQTITNLKLTSGGQIFVVDVNGDAQADLFTADTKGGTLYLSDFSQSNKFATPITLPGMNLSTNPSGNLVADFNNDGLTDVLTYSGTDYNMYFSNGEGFAPGSKLLGINLANTTNWISDFNGDGTMDIYSIVTGNVAIVYYNYGGKFYPLQAKPPTMQTGYTWMGDFNGDGVADIFAANTSAIYFGGDQNSGVVQTSNQVPQLVTSINNGMNGVYQFQYAPMTSSAVYTAGGNSNDLLDGLYLQSRYNSTVLSATQSSLYPYVPIQSTTYLVQRYVENDGMGNSYPYDYKYSGSLTDVQAYGWLGFQQVTRTDSCAGNVNITQYLQPFPYTGSVTSSSLYDRNGNILQRSRAAYTLQTDTLSSMPATTYQVFHTTSRSDHYDYGTFTYTTGINYAYDHFGNNIVQEQLNDTSESNRLYTFYQYQNDTSGWHIGFKTASVVSADTTRNTVLQQFKYQYDPKTWLPVLNSTWLNSNNSWLNNQYGYDVYGNQVMTVSPAGDTATVAYDAVYHSFPVSQTSPPNQWGAKLVNTVVTDPANGQVISATDANGNTFRTLYDQFGRDSVLMGPDSAGNLVVLTQLRYYTGTKAGYEQQRILRSNWAGTAWDSSATGFDGLGRNVGQMWKGINGQTVMQQQTYNSNNQPLTRSLPFFATDQQQTVVFAYDPYQRIININVPGPNGQTIYNTLGYSGKQVSVTHAAGTADSATSYRNINYFNGSSKVVQRTDESGLITQFAYDPLGNSVKVTDPGGLSTAYTFYSTGALAATSNPASGTTRILRNYTANNYAVVFNNGDTIFCQQDALQRNLSVASPDGTTYYQYDLPSVQNGMTNLCKVTGNDAHLSNTYAYDAYHRALTTTLQIGGQSFKEQYRYAADGSLTASQYPDGAIAAYSYYNNGYLNQVSFQNAGRQQAQVFATYTQYDAYGDQLAVRFGNQVQRNASFYPFGLLAGYTISGADSQMLASKNYNWNQVYNINAITDNLNSGNSEYFQYQPNGRLDSASAGYGTSAYKYNASGDILLKEGVSYQYNNQYQVTGAQQQNNNRLFSAGYDTNGNLSWRTQYQAGDSTQLQYRYNAFNQLRAILSGRDTLYTFAYNYTGQRVIKRDYGKKTTTLYVAPDYTVTISAQDTLATKYVCAPSQIIASVSGTGDVLFLHQNFVNSTILSSDSSGAVAGSVQYLPFGSPHILQGDTVSRLFGSMELDESGLYYFNSRYYDPVTGRFLTSDNRLGGSKFQTDVYNRYAYTVNNPVKFYDPSGHVLEDAGIILALEAVADIATDGAALPLELAADATAEAEVGAEFLSALKESLGSGIDRDQVVAMYKARRDAVSDMTVDERFEAPNARREKKVMDGLYIDAKDAHGNDVFVNKKPGMLRDEVDDRNYDLKRKRSVWANTPEKIDAFFGGNPTGSYKFVLSFENYELSIGSDDISHAAVQGKGRHAYTAGYFELDGENLKVNHRSGHYQPSIESTRMAEPLWRMLRARGIINFNSIIYKTAIF